MILLVRHAWAGNREEWEGDDRARPLDKRGRAQAKELVKRLADYRIEAVLTSPAVRCIETIAPLARARGLEIDVRHELSDDLHGVAGAGLLRSLAGRDVVVCGHGGLEDAVPGARKWKKGETLVLDDDLAIQGSV